MAEIKTLIEVLGLDPRSSPLTVVLLAMLVGNYFGVWAWGRHVKAAEERADQILALAEAMAAVMESAGLKLPNHQQNRRVRIERDRVDSEG